MLYIVADLHSNIERTKTLLEKASVKYGQRPCASDIVLVLGDLLEPLSSRMSKQEKFAEDVRFLAWLSRQPFEIASVRGNRDTDLLINRLNGVSDMAYSGPVIRMNDNVVFLNDGKTYWFPIGNGERVHVLSLGGAFSHIARFTKLSVNTQKQWATKYLSLKHTVHKNQADLILSHDVPASEMKMLKLLFGRNIVNDELELVKKNSDYKKWLFGHHHMDIRLSQTCRGIYNDILCISTREDIRAL